MQTSKKWKKHVLKTVGATFFTCFYQFITIILSLFEEYYRAFHRFGQAKFASGGLILGSSQLTLLPQLPLKNNA